MLMDRLVIGLWGPLPVCSDNHHVLSLGATGQPHPSPMDGSMMRVEGSSWLVEPVGDKSWPASILAFLW